MPPSPKRDPEPADPDFLTVSEVARRLSVSKHFIYPHLDDWFAGYVLVGKEIRIPFGVYRAYRDRLLAESAERRARVRSA